MKVFAKYLLVGGVNTALTLSVIYLLIVGLDVHHLLANFMGYLLGFLCSFVLNKRFTFRAQGETLWEFIGFSISFGLAYALSVGALLLFMQIELLPYVLCTVLSMGTYTVASFILNKSFVFTQDSRRC